MEGYWMIRTYTAGKVGEKTKFFVPGVREKTVRGIRREKKAMKAAEAGEASAVKELARLINANTGDGGLDMLIGLDYSEKYLQRMELTAETDGMDEEEKRNAVYAAAQHECELLIRRVKAELGKRGEQLKYICVTSDMDGDTGEAVRVHHHLLISGGMDAAQVIIDKWGKRGTVNYKRLREQEDFTPVAEYLMRQVRRIENSQRYIPSRNLIRVRPVDRPAMNDSRISVPKGARLLHATEYKRYAPQYIRYLLPKDALGKKARAAAKRDEIERGEE